MARTKGSANKKSNGATLSDDERAALTKYHTHQMASAFSSLQKARSAYGNLTALARADLGDDAVTAIKDSFAPATSNESDERARRIAQGRQLEA